MRFAIGLFDYLFGEKVTLEIPTEDGQVRKRKVSRRWLEAMERQGHMQKPGDDLVRVHHLGLHGYSVEHCVVGRDISTEDVQRFRDPKTQDVYAMSFLENGEPRRVLLKRDKWEDAKAQLQQKGFV